MAKKNMRVLTYADLNLPAGSSQLPDAAPAAPSSITREVRLRDDKKRRKISPNPQNTEQKWLEKMCLCHSMSIILFLFLHIGKMEGGGK